MGEIKINKVVRRIYMLLFICICNSFLYSQTTISIQDTIVKSAIEIFNELKIPIRKTIAKDSPIKIIVSDSVNLFNGSFYLGNYYNQIINYGTDSAYLINPYIVISPLLFDVLYKRKDTTENALLKAKSSLIHEISHYLFTAYFEKNYYAPKGFTKKEMERYIGQPYELFAYAVEAYYYYKYQNPPLLKKIIKSQKTNENKYKALAASKYREDYPFRKPIFLDKLYY